LFQDINFQNEQQLNQKLAIPPAISEHYHELEQRLKEKTLSIEHTLYREDKINDKTKLLKQTPFKHAVSAATPKRLPNIVK